MPAPNPKCFHLSASSVAAFKACPTRFRLAYREGLRVAEDTESQRVGTNWHSIHEVYQNTEGDDDARINAVVQHMNDRYAKVPPGKDAREWDLERQILVTSFIAYLWYYAEDTIEYLRQEIPFDLPLYGPRTGLPLSLDEVKRVGKIDHLIRWQGMVGVLERKATTRSIDSDSDYWDKSRKDTQVSMYALALQELAIVPGADRFGSTLYDVWRRPQTKPKMLTQGATAEFIESGKYQGESFGVSVCWPDNSKPGEGTPIVEIDGVIPEIEPGKKGFAIRETNAMYAARLLADIQADPSKFFQRREIARTDKDLAKFKLDLFNVYQAQKSMDKTGGWFENEAQCRATFPCPMIPICYGPGADAVCDGQTTPQGYKRIFVDLTVEGQAVGEEGV